MIGAQQIIGGETVGAGESDVESARERGRGASSLPGVFHKVIHRVFHRLRWWWIGCVGGRVDLEIAESEGDLAGGERGVFGESAGNSKGLTDEGAPLFKGDEIRSEAIFGEYETERESEDGAEAGG